jgi:hypothetical protein
MHSGRSRTTAGVLRLLSARCLNVTAATTSWS